MWQYSFTNCKFVQTLGDEEGDFDGRSVAEVLEERIDKLSTRVQVNFADIYFHKQRKEHFFFSKVRNLLNYLAKSIEVFP